MSLLKVEDLTHFFGGLRSVDDFNLELGDNELVGLIGPNGAGKSTVFNLVCGLYRPTRKSSLLVTILLVVVLIRLLHLG